MGSRGGVPFAIVLSMVVRAISEGDDVDELTTPFRYVADDDCCETFAAMPAFVEIPVPPTGTRQMGIWLT